jgi:hypothetical protein
LPGTEIGPTVAELPDAAEVEVAAVEFLAELFDTTGFMPRRG